MQDMTLEDMRTLLNNRTALKSYLHKESIRTGKPPMEILYLLVKEYRKRISEIAIRN